MTRHIIVALFDDFGVAKSAIHDLEDLGIPAARISVVANNAGGRYDMLKTQQAARAGSADQAERGLAIGAAAGGGAGLLAGLAALVLPGVGPLIAAGTLAVALFGVGAGAAAGGLVGALVGSGVSRAHADIYAEAIRHGGTLIAVEADTGDHARIAAVIARHHPVDVDERRAQRPSVSAAVAPAGATTTSGAPADHGASAGPLPAPAAAPEAMPTGSGALGTTATEAGRIRAYPAPEREL